MQLPVLGCTFLTLVLMISALMIGAQQYHPPVLPTCAQQCTHLCPAVLPPVPRSATYLCPAVPPTCAQKCHLPVPSSATHLCPP
ncbi:unnamed protein product, partial [Staurois parvus]